MKNSITYLKALWSRVADSQSTDVSLDCRLTVGSPSGLDAKWKQNPFMRFAVVLTLIFTIGSGNVWGATETLTMSEMGWDNASTQSSIPASSATIALAKNSGSTAPTYYTSDGLRIYGVKSATTGGTIAFTAVDEITQIQFTHTANNSGVLSIKSGGGSYSSKTWTGTLTAGNTLTLVATNSGTKAPQVRITVIAITYKAKVTFNANGGSCATANATQSTPTSTVTLPTPTRAGFTCTGWYTASSGGTKRGNAGATYTPSASETLYAQWESSAPACSNAVALSKGSATNGTVNTISSANVATCSATASDRRVTITITPDDCYDAPTNLTWTKSSGTVTASKYSGPTGNGNGTYSYVYQFAQNDNGAGTFGVTCTAKAAGKTVNFDAGPGSCGTSSLTETCDGSGVTLPAVTATGVCKGWTTFAGWRTSAIATADSTTTNPGTLYAAGSTYYPSSDNETLYAVFSKTKGGGTTPTKETLTFGTSYASNASDLTSVTIYTGITATATEGTTNNPKFYTSSPGTWRMYSGSELTISSSIGNITKIEFTKSSDFSLSVKSGESGTLSSETWTYASGVSSITFNVGGTTKLSAIAVTYLAPSSTTYYCSDPNCCTPLGTINGSNLSTSSTGTSVSVSVLTEGVNAYGDANNVSGYDFNLYTAASGGSAAATYSSDSKDGTSHEFTGLTPLTQYWVTVRPIGSGSYCNTTAESDRVAIYTCPGSPNHVDVSGRWDRFGGETISLTAAAYATAGTGTAIPAAKITGYQWQKWYNSQWNNISNAGTTSGATTNNLQITSCSNENSGSYRCVVSTVAGCDIASDGFQVKVYALECYNSGTTVYNFTRTGDTQAGTVQIDLSASTNYGYKVHADNDYYGNSGTVNEDVVNWEMSTGVSNNLTVSSGLGGTFTFAIDYSTGGNNSTEGIPEISVTYPRKTIYLTPGVWNTGGAKFAFYYYRDAGSSGWTDFITANDCGSSADIPQWNGVKINAVRLSDECSSPDWSDKWNQTSNITITSNNSVSITGWGPDKGDSPYDYGTYAVPTYTISYAKGSVPTGGGSISGSKADETKTCGVDFTLPAAQFTTTGYVQTGWSKADGGAQYAAVSGSYTDNSAQTFYPVWTANTHTLTWDKNGGDALTGDYTSGTVAYATAITAPNTPTWTGHTFNGWHNGSSIVTPATTMPDNDLTYTAQWSLATYTVTLNTNGGTINSGNVTSYTYGTGATLPTDVTRDGYRFDGWFSDDGVWSDQVTAISTTATGDKTYYAKWTAIYTVTWHVNGSVYNTGVVSGNSQVISGGKISVCPTAPLDNTLACANKFMGWSENNAGATAKTASYYDDLFTDVAGSPYINANKDFYAVFAESSGGENILISNVSELTAGTQVYIYAETSDVSPFTAVMKAYESGNNVRAVSGSVSTNKLTPSEGACAYTIGEVTVSATKYYTFNDGTYYLRATGTDKNYLVGAAALGDDEKGLFSISIDAGVFSITCKNTSVRGVMQFNKNGDTGVYDKALFACYSSASQTNVQLFKKNPLVFSNYVTECDANIVAVTYNANSGSTSCMNTTTDKTEDFTVCATEPTRDYYTFDGWLCSADDEVYDAGATILAAAIDADFSLTAQWTPETYTITYELDGGTNSGSNPASYNVETSTITLQNPTKGHDRFDGWYDNGSFTGDAITSIPLGSHGDITLHAKWTTRHHIEFFKEGVSVGEIWRADDENMEDAVAGQGSVPSDPSAPTTCSSKVFVGWTEEPIDDETDDEPADLMKPAAGTVDEDKEFHAVWDTESSSSGTETIFTDDFNVTGIDEVTSRSGWTDLSTVYGGSGSIRFSSGKNAGSMTLDVSGMEMSGTWEIKFKIKKYGSDGSGALAVSSAFGDVTTSFSPTSVSTTDGANWTEKTITVTGVHSGTEIHFDGTANSRVYVKDVEIKRTGTITTHSAYSTSCCATKVTLSQNSPEHGTIAFGKTSVRTCNGDKNVLLTITPEAGYQLHSYDVATGVGKVATKSVSPAISLDNNSSAVQNITLTFAEDANGAYDVTASFSLMTVTSWAWTLNSAAIPDPLNLYVGQNARLDVAYTPADVDASKKTYSRTKVDTYINWVGGKQSAYTTISGRATTGENTTAVTFTHADGPTKTVNVKVLPLPLTHFADLVHGKAFADVEATIVDNALSATKNTPTSDDWTTPNANDCESGHLHLVGWIREDWPALVAYLNGTGDAPTTTAIVGAGNDGSGHAYYIAAGASIDVQTFDGVTFYAVWAEIK